MKANALISGVVTAVAFSLTMPAGQTSSPIPLSQQISSDNEIRQILVDRIDGQHQSLGIVVGVVTPVDRRVVSYGVFGNNDSRSITGATIFEIGSVTKVFTSWLFADMARRGAARYGTSQALEPFSPSRVRVTLSCSSYPVYRSCACARKAKPISLSQRTPEFQSPSRSTLAIRLHGCC